MRILWFGRSGAGGGDGEVGGIYAREAAAPIRAVRGGQGVRAARPRGDDEVTLALSTLPRYRVLLRLRPQDAATADAWEGALTPALGERRAAEIVAAAMRDGAAPITTCPRELAEYYRDALTGYGLPCAIEPA